MNEREEKKGQKNEKRTRRMGCKRRPQTQRQKYRKTNRKANMKKQR